MKPKTFFLFLLLVGAYIVGARAGRERYEQIVGSVTSLWNDPSVKKSRKKAKKQFEKARKRLS